MGNPHNPRWGDMKLYLELQIEKRAMEVWETQEKLEEEHVLRDEKREKSKVSKFNKQLCEWLYEVACTEKKLLVTSTSTDQKNSTPKRIFISVHAPLAITSKSTKKRNRPNMFLRFSL